MAKKNLYIRLSVAILAIILIGIYSWQKEPTEDTDISLNQLSSSNLDSSENTSRGRFRRPLLDSPIRKRSKIEGAGTKEASRRKGPRVRVVEQETRRPIPGAILAFVDHDGPANGILFKTASGADRFDELSSDFGRLLQADEFGEVILPHFTKRADIRASAAQGRSHPMSLFHDMLHEVIEVEIRNLQSVLIDVVDAQGQPVARQPVGLSSTSRNPFVEREQSVTWTNERGRATLILPPWRSLGDRFFVYAKALSLSIDKIEITRDYKGEVVTLRKRPGATMRVRVLDHQGDPYNTPLILSVTGQSANGKSTPTLSRIVTHGSVEIRDVETNLMLKVHAAAMEPGHLVASRSLSGPTQPGEIQEIQLAFEEPGAEIRFKLIDSSGRLVHHQALSGELEVYDGDELVNSEELDAWKSGANGEVILRLDDKLGRTPNRSRILVWKNGDDHSQDQYAYIQLPPPTWDQIHVGEIQLKVAPTILDGVVKNENQKPIPHCTINIETKDGAEGFGEFATTTTRTDENGRFSFACIHQDVKSVNIMVNRAGFQPQKKTIDVPTKQVEIILQSGASLSIPVILEAPAAAIQLQAQLTGPPARGIHSLNDSLDPQSYRLTANFIDGSIEFRGLAPGVARLKILSPFNRGKTLVDLGRVEIHPNSENTHRELAPVNLKGLVRIFAPTIIDENQQPLSGVRGLAKIDGRIIGKGTTNNLGKLIFAAPSQAFSLTLTKSGFRTMTQDGGALSPTIQMQTGFRVSFDVGTGTSHPKRPVYLLGRVFDPKSPEDKIDFYFDEIGRASGTLPKSGDYEMQFELVRESKYGASSSSKWHLPGMKLTFRVAPSSAPQIVSIPCDLEEVKRIANLIR